MTQATEQQAARKRFSFGPVWSRQVVEGSVKDHEKLLAHAIKLKLGPRGSLKGLKFETLLGKVASALKAEEKGGSKKKEKEEETAAA